MDAREQLRRFLEQRRELGETELILDRMTVDEVLRIVGAPKRDDRGTAPSGSGRPPARTPAAGSVMQEYFQRGDSPSDARRMLQPTEQSSDWREVMRASDAKAAGSAQTAGAAKAASDAQTGSGAGASSSAHVTSPAGPAPAGAPVAVVSAASLDSPPVAPPPASRIPGIDAPLGLVVGPTERDLANPFAGHTTLQELAETIAKCTRCPLFATAKNPVPGQGNPNADFVCVGEAPGANEDEQGLAFVGQAGGLLTKILEAVQLSRDDVFICNVLKHRPPGNRNPQPLEVEACAPYLVRQLELIRPKVILALGTFAAQTLLNTKLSIGKLRGSVHRYYGIPTIVTYHPAALLRNPAWKRPTWEDVQLARRILDSASAHA